MPATVSLIDAVTALPLDALQQVLDVLGPYTAGDYTLGAFATSGGFLLPAGAYPVHGTYGVIWQATGLFPAAAGSTIGYSDPLTFPVGDYYQERICQLVPLIKLPTTGLWMHTDIVDAHSLRGMITWPLHYADQRLGLHVDPAWTVDLYYLCIG